MGQSIIVNNVLLFMVNKVYTVSPINPASPCTFEIPLTMSFYSVLLCLCHFAGPIQGGSLSNTAYQKGSINVRYHPFLCSPAESALAAEHSLAGEHHAESPGDRQEGQLGARQPGQLLHRIGARQPL